MVELKAASKWTRFLNMIGWRKDTLWCCHKDDTWCWPKHLGKLTLGRCNICDGSVYYERQNWMFRKICFRCVMRGKQ